MSRAPVRFRARYIRVTPSLTEASGAVRIDIAGLKLPDTVDEEIAQGQALAKLVEVVLNAALVVFDKPRKRKGTYEFYVDTSSA